MKKKLHNEDITVEQTAEVDTENLETSKTKKFPQKETKEEISEEIHLSQQETVREMQEPFIKKEQEQPVEEVTEEVEPEEKRVFVCRFYRFWRS